MITTLKSFRDGRGELTPFSLSEIPFKVKRVFFVRGYNDVKRGGHAHKECQQLVYCITGTIVFTNKDGEGFSLSQGECFHINTGEWYEQLYKHDAYACVFCSHEYDKNDYIK